MSGSATVVPGYLIQDGEKATNAKFRLMATPVVNVGAGQITATELSSSINAQLAAVTTAIVTVTAKSANFTVQTTDKGTLFNVSTGGSDVTATLPAAATSGNGWYIWLRKSDTGTGRVLTSATTTPNPSILSKQDQRMMVFTDAVNYYGILFLVTMDPSGNLTIANVLNITLLPTNLVQIGGATAGFPAFKNSGATLSFRLADDSGDASILAKNVTCSGRVLNSADVAVAIVSNAGTVDWTQGNSFYTASAVTAATTITIANNTNSQTITFAILQDGTGSRAITWTATPAIKWAGGSTPTSSGANKWDFYTINQKNGVLYGIQSANF